VLGALLFCSAGQAAATDRGPLAHYPMRQGSGDIAVDAGPNKLDGKVSAAKWVAGGGLGFDGAHAYVDCGAGKRLGLDHDLTVAAWIRPQGRPVGEPLIVGEGTAQWGLTHYKGRVYFYISGGANHCKAAVSYHQWSHAAGTFDGTTLRLYVNGDLRAKKELAAPTKIKSGATLMIGADGRRQGFFDGVIRDVRVYGRVLPAEEIAGLAGTPGGAPQALPLSAAQTAAATEFFSTHGLPVASLAGDGQVCLANRHVGVAFAERKESLAFARLYGVAAAQDLVVASRQGIWQLVLRRDRGRDGAEVTVTSRAQARVSTRIDREGTVGALRLRWENLPVADEADALDVEVVVTLRAGDRLSRWRINVANRSRTYGLWSVVFPLFDVKAIGNRPETNAWAMGRARGAVTKDPFSSSPSRSFDIGTNSGCHWPGTFNLQFQALHDDSGQGTYLATHDGGGHKKTFYFTPFKDRLAIEYKVRHYPANMGYAAEDFRMPYDACIGPFQGDWYDACQLYRGWALRQQWCSRGPLGARTDVPEWYKFAPITYSAFSKKGDEVVMGRAQRMIDHLRFIDAKLPVVWYTWKKHFPEMTDYNKPGSPWRVPDARPYPCGNIHDGNYPLLPALPNFSKACRQIADAGGFVKAYVCARIYDQGLDENAPLAAQAKPNVVRDVQGALKLAERETVSWLMCYHTDWWRQRLADTVTALIQRENVRGIYFDTFYGGYTQCFHTEHGHSHGGGADPYLGARKISAVVRGAMKKADPESVMSGENPAETAIDLLDGFLYRDTIRPDTAPLFATVYGDYVCRHGVRLDPKSDGFYIQCAALFTEGGQMGRLRVHADDHFLADLGPASKYADKMEFMRKLARCWRQEIGGKHLGYGQLLRPLRFAAPDPMPAASYTAPRCKYKGGLIAVAALQAGVFLAPDGSLGVFVVNVTDAPVSARFDLSPDRYPIDSSKPYVVVAVDEEGRERGRTSKHTGGISFAGEIGGRDVLFLKATPGD